MARFAVEQPVLLDLRCGAVRFPPSVLFFVVLRFGFDETWRSSLFRAWRIGFLVEVVASGALVG